MDGENVTVKEGLGFVEEDQGMRKGKIIMLVVGIVVLLVILGGGFWYLQSGDTSEECVRKCLRDGMRTPEKCGVGCGAIEKEVNGNSLCGDGICGDKELANSELCPEDCEKINDHKDQNIDIIDYDDSPFGYLNSPDLEKYSSDLGVKWTRTAAKWGLVQPETTFEEGVYNWEAIEARWNMGEYPSDLNWVITISFLGTEIESTGSYMPSVYPHNKENYLLYVEALVNRYKDEVKFFQVENEPKQGMTDFAELQKITYNKVKEVCPDCYVLIAGYYAGNGREPAFDANMLPILTELNGDYVDIFDIHWFGAKVDSNIMDPLRESSGKLNVDIIKEKLRQANFENIDIWITESGTYSGMPIQYDYQSESEQASSVIKRYISPIAKGVKKIMWAWGTTESFKRDCRFFDFTGLVYDGCDCDGDEYICSFGIGYDLGRDVKKLGYYTYKLMTQKLEGSDWDNVEIIQESNEVYVYEFVNNGESIWVAWSDSGSGSVLLSSLGISSAKVTEAVPDYDNGKEILDGGVLFEDMFDVSFASGSVELGDVPVFIEED